MALDSSFEDDDIEVALRDRGLRYGGRVAGDDSGEEEAAGVMCAACGDRFDTLDECRRHESDTHGTEDQISRKCPDCEETFGNQGLLLNHQWRHHTSKTKHNPSGPPPVAGAGRFLVFLVPPAPYNCVPESFWRYFLQYTKRIESPSFPKRHLRDGFTLMIPYPDPRIGLNKLLNNTIEIYTYLTSAKQDPREKTFVENLPSYFIETDAMPPWVLMMDSSGFPRLVTLASQQVVKNFDKNEKSVLNLPLPPVLKRRILGEPTPERRVSPRLIPPPPEVPPTPPRGPRGRARRQLGFDANQQGQGQDPPQPDA